MQKQVRSIGRIVKAHTIYSIQKLANTEDCYATCAGKVDGLGAQLHAILSTMLFANDMGIQYAHTPFTKIEHNTFNDELWESKWESFFNLGKGELGVSQVRESVSNTIYLNNPMKVRKKNGALYILPHCHAYADMFPDNYLKLRNKLLKKYNLSSKNHLNLHYDPQKINIALHVRRGDISRKSPSRYTENQYIASILKKVLSSISEFNIEVSICLYSQGNIDDFSEFHDLDIRFYLDDCVFSTFHNLIFSDVFLMSKSSFSYSAGIFSDGIKIYEPFDSKPLKPWIVTNKQAQFNETILKQKVNKLLIERGFLTGLHAISNLKCNI